MGAGTATGTLGSGSVTDNAWLYLARSDDFTLSNAISGSGGLTKVCDDTATLDGANSYAGDTSIYYGTLAVGNSDAIPYGPGHGGVGVGSTSTLDLMGHSITVNGLGGSGTVTSGVAGDITLTVGADDQWSTFDGQIEDGAGSVALTKIGAGTLTLGGLNTYSGVTTISAGTLCVGDGAPAQLGPNSVTDNGQLQFALDEDATITNVIAGTGSVVDAGSGILTLAAANDFHGYSMLFNGTTRIGNVHAIPSGTGYGDVGLNGTLDLNGYSITINGISGTGIVTNNAATSATLTIGANGESVAFNGTIEDGAGTVSLTKIGAGTLTLVPPTGRPDSYSGLTTVAGGILQVGGPGSHSQRTGQGQRRGRCGIDLNGYNVTLAGLTGSGTVETGGYGSSTLTVGANDQTSEFDGTIQENAGTIAIAKFGSGTLTLSPPTSTPNTYSGGTTVIGGTLQLGRTGALGTGPLTLTAGTVDLHGFSQTVSALNGQSDAAITNLGTATSTLTVSAGGTFAGSIADGATGGQVALDSSGGTLVLSGSDTYSGGTTVTGGTLQLGSTGGPGAGGLTLTAGTLDLAGFNQTVTSLNGLSAGTITNLGDGTSSLTVSAGGTYAGSITDGPADGTVALVNAGGTLALMNSANQSDYSGGTSLRGGMLSFADGALGCGDITFSGGTLQWAAGNTDDVPGSLPPSPAARWPFSTPTATT